MSELVRDANDIRVAPHGGEIHILVNAPGIPLTIAARLKTRESADEMIAALVRFRDEVFGGIPEESSEISQ